MVVSRAAFELIWKESECLCATTQKCLYLIVCCIWQFYGKIVNLSSLSQQNMWKLHSELQLYCCSRHLNKIAISTALHPHGFLLELLNTNDEFTTWKNKVIQSGICHPVVNPLVAKSKKEKCRRKLCLYTVFQLSCWSF